MPKGQLDNVKKLMYGPDKPFARAVRIPIEIDLQKAVNNAGGLADDRIRSFELWWDAEESKLQSVLISDKHDANNFKYAFQTMYPNAAFEDLHETIPEWFDRKSKYHVFDIGTRHGHYATVFDTKPYNLMTSIARTIQPSRRAWIQFVFRRFDCTSFLTDHMQRMEDKFKEINNKEYQSEIDAWREIKPHPHPELGYDFTSNFQGLKDHVIKKMQGAHIILSIRGLVQDSVNMPLDNVFTNSIHDISSTYDHLEKYSYKYDKFCSEKKKSRVKVQGSWRASDQRVCMFESRHLPNQDQFFNRALSEYFNKKWCGILGYRTRRPIPFLILNSHEMSFFTHLPDSSTPNVDITRGVHLPSKPSEKTGADIGSFDTLQDDSKSDTHEGIL